MCQPSSLCRCYSSVALHSGKKLPQSADKLTNLHHHLCVLFLLVRCEAWPNTFNTKLLSFGNKLMSSHIACVCMSCWRAV